MSGFNSNSSDFSGNVSEPSTSAVALLADLAVNSDFEAQVLEQTANAVAFLANSLAQSDFAVRDLSEQAVEAVSLLVRRAAEDDTWFFSKQAEFTYLLYVMWGVCDEVCSGVWNLGFNTMASKLYPLCLKDLMEPLSALYRRDNNLPARQPIELSLIPSNFPFTTNQRKEDFIEQVIERPCFEYVKDMNNAYQNGPLLKIQKETRKIGVGALRAECSWQMLIFFAGLFSNATLLKGLSVFSDNGTTTAPSTTIPTFFTAYKVASALLEAVKLVEPNITVQYFKEKDFLESGNCIPSTEKGRLFSFLVKTPEQSYFWYIQNQTHVSNLIKFCKAELTNGSRTLSRPSARKIRTLKRYLAGNLFPTQPQPCTESDLLIHTTTRTPCTRTTTPSHQRREITSSNRPVTYHFNHHQQQTTTKHHGNGATQYNRGKSVRRNSQLSQPRHGYK